MVDHDDPFDGGIQQRVQLFNRDDRRTCGKLCMPGSGTRASEIAPVRAALPTPMSQLSKSDLGSGRLCR